MSAYTKAGTCEYCGTKGRNYPATPTGYLQRIAWFETKSKTHYQELCAGCQRYTIWRKRPRPVAVDTGGSAATGSEPS